MGGSPARPRRKLAPLELGTWLCQPPSGKRGRNIFGCFGVGFFFFFLYKIVRREDIIEPSSGEPSVILATKVDASRKSSSGTVRLSGREIIGRRLVRQRFECSGRRKGSGRRRRCFHRKDERGSRRGAFWKFEVQRISSKSQEPGDRPGNDPGKRPSRLGRSGSHRPATRYYPARPGRRAPHTAWPRRPRANREDPAPRPHPQSARGRPRAWHAANLRSPLPDVLSR